MVDFPDLNEYPAILTPAEILRILQTYTSRGLVNAFDYSQRSEKEFQRVAE